MKKKRSTRLATLVDMAKNDSSEAAHTFQEAKIAFDLECEKLKSLQAYFDEYSQSRSGLLLNASQMQRQQSFLSQVYVAQRQQCDVVSKHKKLVDKLQDNWRKTSLKHKALVDLVERITDEENKDYLRKEEKLLDDWYLQTAHSREDRKL